MRKADKKRMKKQQKALERKIEAEGKKCTEIIESAKVTCGDEVSPQLESLAI